MIHEAIKVWDYKSKDNPNNVDPAMCFVPEAIFGHVLPGPKSSRIIFILRRYNPLLVDPESKKVWVYPVTDWYRQCFPRLDPPSDAFLASTRILWIAGADRDFRSYRFDENTGRLQVVRDRPNWHIGNVRTGSLARAGDWLYYSGSNWRRISLRTGEEELLLDNPRALPKYGQRRRLAHRQFQPLRPGRLLRRHAVPRPDQRKESHCQTIKDSRFFRSNPSHARQIDQRKKHENQTRPRRHPCFPVMPSSRAERPGKS